MKAYVIPADSSEHVRKIDFNRDKSWRYVVTRYKEPGMHPFNFTEVAFLTKENAPRDYLLRNSRASEYLKNHSDDLNSPENLYGDVVVLGYDSALDILTDVPWPHSPEDFEDLLTRIVTPPERVPTEAENDEVIRKSGERPGRNPPPAPAPRDDLSHRPEPYERAGPPDRSR
jgi:hypothetical protein